MLLGDDLLVCILGGVYTDVEKTMIELQRETVVQRTRSEFQMAMVHKFIEVILRQAWARDGCLKKATVRYFGLRRASVARLAERAA